MRELLRDASEVFRFCAKRTKILAALSWEPNVAREFIKGKATQMPKPRYPIDRQALEEAKEALAKLPARLRGEHPVMAWLRRTHSSYIQGIELLLNVETPVFNALSSQLYGDTHTKLVGVDTTHLELAQALAGRMSVCSVNDIEESFVQRSAEDFAKLLQKKIDARKPHLPVRIEITDEIVAKVVAGMNRVRIRVDARFSDMELEALWNHEVESHSLTAHNGVRQEACPFLASGGPRTTRTQEGLAVFYEVYGHTMSPRRFVALCHRVEAVSLAENGADFIEVYRWYRSRTDSDIEAFYNTQRVFRGAVLTGRYPFTKDVVYLAGLLEVFHFLQAAAKTQNRILIESLVCGRIALEDVSTLAWLRTHGILEPPFYVPAWLSNWEALLSFFSLSAVLNTFNLQGMEKYFQENHGLDDWDFGL